MEGSRGFVISVSRSGSFGQNHRLLSKSDFDYLKDSRKKFWTPYITFYYKKSRLNQQDTRIGFKIPKRVGKAHLRNRFKRILRESFRTSQYKMLGFDIVIFLGNNLVKTFEDQVKREEILKRDFLNLFKKIQGRPNG